jgi:hypothetical protein
MNHLIYWSIAITLTAISICIMHFAGLFSVNTQVAAAFWCGIIEAIIMFIVAGKIYGENQ